MAAPHRTLLHRLEAVARHIEAHADAPLLLAELAALAALSPAHFQRQFRAHFSVTPKQYQDGCRRQRLRAALQGGAAVKVARDVAGLTSEAALYGREGHLLGLPAGRYRRGGAGEVLHAVYRETAIGPLLLAASAVGVCFVEFGDSEQALQAQLAREFPGAEVRPALSSMPLDAWMTALDAHIAAKAPAPDLPLDLRGTAFQISVWRFLRTIPEGQRMTYTEVARGIGADRAVRAAASACGANRIALLVPCHRVLRGDGGLGGYRWGLERKQHLLDLEARRAAQ
jgi:AraC family transcriptional regulator of adaptative response/methylated-DNA-[protein]-cysteine methyltransferase